MHDFDFRVDATEPHRDHVIIAGYGLAGRALCEAFRSAVIARTQYESDEPILQAAGASRVVSAETTASVALVNAALEAVSDGSQEGFSRPAI